MNKTLIACVVTFGLPAHGAVFHVGPGMPYEKPSEVAAVARDGDTIEIEMAAYDGDVAVWTQSNLTIRGIGGRPQLRARGKSAEGKAIWVIKGDDTVIENIEFSGARVSDRNGAGIRLEGTNLTVRNCFFHDNENGILTGEDAESEILVEYTEFSNNGHGDGYSHNIYIGRVARFTLQYSYSHHARVGHQVKSRAKENHIRFNRLMDEVSGESSYIVDLPDPGVAYIVGNDIQQGPRAENWAIINVAQKAWVVNNTVVNDRGNGVFIRLSGDEGLLQNNIFAGRGTLETGGAELRTNLVSEFAGLVDRARYDYRLDESSEARDNGTPVEALIAPAVPVWEYVHPLSSRKRSTDAKMDVGAHEFPVAE